MVRHRNVLHLEGGQILVVAALFASALVGMVGLIIDAGYLASQRRQTQNASDAAALAAARIMLEQRSIGDARDAAAD
jgi:uncharacterized membrane protein